MNDRDPRPFSYDTTTYSSGQNSQESNYISGYGYSSYYPSSSHTLGSANDAPNSSTPYFRSLTPSLVSPQRYPQSDRDDRYSSSSSGHGYTASSSYAPPLYPNQQQYSTQYTSPPPATHNHTQFIPTPSQIANSYSSYSPVGQDGLYSSPSLNFPAPPHIVPSSRPRISTARPRNGSAVPSNSPTGSSPSSERFPCEKCGKTFSRSHDRKRHHETQHLASPVVHRCVYCQKEFSRADSLKRHLDNGCDEMHP